MSEPDKVICSGRGLRFGYRGQCITSTIDTSKAGPGELTVYCQGMTQRALCELEDNEDGTFTLQVDPQEGGHHQLNIKYDREHVPGSPFNLHVSTAGMVRVMGPGIENGLRIPGQDEFVVDLRDVSPGEVTVEVGGPSRKFKLKTRTDGKRLYCHYNPKKAGEYQIIIKWDRDHIYGSPFTVYKADNMEQLADNQSRRVQHDMYNSTV